MLVFNFNLLVYVCMTVNSVGVLQFIMWGGYSNFVTGRYVTIYLIYIYLFISIIGCIFRK